MKMKIVCIALLVIVMGCAPQEYKCVEDGKKIDGFQQAFVVVLSKSNGAFDPSNFDEQKFHVASLVEQATIEGVPTEHYAMGYKDKLFCSSQCAEMTMKRKNAEVDQRIRRRVEEDRKDSLFSDSLHKGSIR